MHQPIVTRRAHPYPGVGAGMYVPDELWRHSLTIADLYREKQSEALVLWGGVVCGPTLTVTGLYIPRHSVQGYGVALTPSESRWLLRRLRARDEKLVAQVHSHPFKAFHSAGDDEGAASFHAGYLSIVIPYFGHGVKSPTDCAVFEYNGSRFVEVENADVAKRIKVVMNPEQPEHQGETEQRNNAINRTHRKRNRGTSDR